MQNQQTLRQKIEQLFGLPAMKMPWSLYIGQLNEAGKLTARSIMDIMIVVLTSLEEQETEIKDMKLMSEPKPFTGLEDTKVQPTPIIIEKPKEEPKTTTEKVHEVTEKVVNKGLVDTILGDKPPEPSK